MLKKGIVAAALIAATSAVYAGGPEVPPPAFIGGVYMDVGLSRDNVSDNYSQATNRSFNVFDPVDGAAIDTIVGPTFLSRAAAGAPGWDGFVGFGVNYVWDNEWSLGLELFGDARALLMADN